MGPVRVALLALLVSTHSIRYRILKGSTSTQTRQPRWRFNPFDPIQDTESDLQQVEGAELRGFNPFDPIQDTESLVVTMDEVCPAIGFNPFDPIQDTES